MTVHGLPLACRTDGPTAGCRVQRSGHVTTMQIEDTEVDVQRDDVPGEGCKEEGCPKYYESGGVGRCGVCDCFVNGMAMVGKACPKAVENGLAQHSGPYGRAGEFTDRF